ncbi:hypothetical protein ACGIF2_00540 [Cellulomonas sp. P22]|uniref:hypothetical protein n=1 Tax=Cellulomonas sp. P22 TaxID=3373189 RepID=UPI0037AF5D69
MLPPDRRALPALALTALLAVAVSGCTGDSAPGASPVAAVSATASPSPTESLLAEAPDEHSQVGALVEGFPSDLLPVPEGADVLVSAAEPVDGTDITTVSLNLRAPQDATALVDSLRQPLLAAGFTEAPVAQSEPGLAAQTTFTRGDGSEFLVVGVLDRDGVRTLTLGGRVRTGT